MYTPVLIIGSGIAGLSLAYHLSKLEIDNLVITKTKHYLKSNSLIAPANMRVFKDYETGIKYFASQCNANYEVLNTIYSNQKVLFETFKDMEIEFKETPIGMIPISHSNTTGGYYLLTKFSEKVNNILQDATLVDMKKFDTHIECLVYNQNKFLHINCSVLVFATGGYAGLLKNNDNSNTATGDWAYIVQKETGKLKNISSLMQHPFGIGNGKRVLVGNIVSELDGIYERVNNEFQELIIDDEIFKKIQNNAYHDSKTFCQVIDCFRGKEVYLYYKDEDKIKEKLKQNGYPNNLIDSGKIKVQITFHYSSGGIEVNKDFQVVDRIYAIGECVVDGNKGIGRIPGHPFSSAIISGKIVADQINNIKMEKYEEYTEFSLEKKLKTNDESFYKETKKKLDYYSETVSDVLIRNIKDYDILDNVNKDLITFINELKENMKCVKELQAFYSLNLLHIMIEEKKENLNMELDLVRKELNKYDEAIKNLVALRMSLIPIVADIKDKNNLPLFQGKREEEIYDKIEKFSLENGVKPNLLKDIYQLIIKNALEIEEDTINDNNSLIKQSEKYKEIETLKNSFDKLDNILRNEIPDIINEIKNTYKDSNLNLTNKATLYYNDEINK